MSTSNQIYLAPIFLFSFLAVRTFTYEQLSKGLTSKFLFCKSWLPNNKVYYACWPESSKLFSTRRTSVSISLKTYDSAESERAISRITDAHFESYKANGVVCLRKILPEEWIAELRDELNLENSKHSNPFEYKESECIRRYVVNLDLSRARSDGFRHFGVNSPSAAIACRLMDSSQERSLPGVA